MTFVIAKRTTIAGPDGPITHTVYWTGGNSGYGTSPMDRDAYPFSTYAAALECCGTHKALRDSEEWRVIRSRAIFQMTGS